MKSDSGTSISVWMAADDTPEFPPLEHDETAQVCVVGAGIAGLTTAYLLTRERKSVVLLDDGPIGGGQTARTTAHLASAIDEGYSEIERLHGEDGARRAADSHSSAIDRIEAIAADEGIDCGFRRLDGYLFLAPGQSPEILDRELAAAHRAGLDGVELLPCAPLESFDTGPCLRFPRQARFAPPRYLAGLAAATEACGGKIFTGTHATSITGGRSARVETSGGCTVVCEAVVVATNTPVNDRIAIHTRQAPYMTYVIAARVPRGAVPDALYWDTADPYHYVRLQESTDTHDLLIVGGEDHKVGQADDAPARYARLESWTRQRFPQIETVKFRWSGEVMEPVDGLAYIGRNPLDEPNVYIATGDSGMGMTHGTIAGMLLTDLVSGRDNPWEKLYDPSRITVQAAGEFARENLNVARQYAHWITGEGVASADEIPPGGAAIIQSGLARIAAYRDDDGMLHQRSAVCVHLGCLVSWNSAEKTWDCPCHGSRYDCYGRVINGPANRNLPRTG